MHWTPTDLQDYSRQLDYFQIELAVAGGGKTLLEYVFNVSQPRPDSRQGAGASEGRLCMTWNGKGGKVVDFDKELLARAGISTTNRMLLQVYPALVEDRLAWMEQGNAEREGIRPGLMAAVTRHPLNDSSFQRQAKCRRSPIFTKQRPLLAKVSIRRAVRHK